MAHRLISKYGFKLQAVVKLENITLLLTKLQIRSQWLPRGPKSIAIRVFTVGHPEEISVKYFGGLFTQ